MVRKNWGIFLFRKGHSFPNSKQLSPQVLKNHWFPHPLLKKREKKDWERKFVYKRDMQTTLPWI
jgi:hypothetical protein